MVTLVAPLALVVAPLTFSLRGAQSPRLIFPVWPGRALRRRIQIASSRSCYLCVCRRLALSLAELPLWLHWWWTGSHAGHDAGSAICHLLVLASLLVDF